jgi:hypothetical protein
VIGDARRFGIGQGGAIADRSELKAAPMLVQWRRMSLTASHVILEALRRYLEVA